jgi:hypothetical protein
MPEQLLADAGGDRDEAIRLLKRFGYILHSSRPRREPVAVPRAPRPDVLEVEREAEERAARETEQRAREKAQAQARERAEAQAREREEAERAPAPAARPYHRTLDGIKDLADAVEQGPPSATRPLGGGMSAQVDLLTLRDGTRVVRKTSRGEDARRDADAELLSSLVARKLGIRAPRIYRNAPDTVFMDYAEGLPTGQELIGYSDIRPQRVLDAFDSDGGRLVGLFDPLVGNRDRNNGNWLLDADGGLVCIDQGEAWSEPPTDGGVDLNSYSDFSDHYAEDGNPLTVEDVEETRRRLESLRPDFRHLGRGPWLDYSLRVLDALAPRARGTRNLIAGTVTP